MLPHSCLTRPGAGAVGLLQARSLNLEHWYAPLMVLFFVLNSFLKLSIGYYLYSGFPPALCSGVTPGCTRETLWDTGG